MLEAGKLVTEHTRSLHKGSEDLILDHYLKGMDRKPGAMAGSTALAAVDARRQLLAASAAPPAASIPATASKTASIPRPVPSLAGYDHLLSEEIA